MNYFRVRGVLIAGIQAIPVQIECAQSRRLPFLQILGASAGESSELRERVIAALDANGLRLPARRITIQFQPGVQNLPLAQLDLAVAVALLASSGKIPRASVENLLFSGSLGLDGSLRPSGNCAALRRLIQDGGFRSAIVPWQDSEALDEAHLSHGGGFQDLGEVLAFLREPGRLGRRSARDAEGEAPPPSLLWDRIEGQELAPRMLEVSAAGAHHVLLSGPSSARPDLLAHALSTLLPPLSHGEAEEVRAIYALAGLDYLWPTRPFFAFSSSLSLPPLLADRRLAKVEECLLAHRGVLYVDRICEREAALFPAFLPVMLTGTLPARAGASLASVPADPIILAASTACGCGAKGDERLVCTCRPTEARRFTERWRRLQRYPFDLSVTLEHEANTGGVSTPWQERAARVQTARAAARARQTKENSRLSEEEVRNVKPWRDRARKIWNVFDARQGASRHRSLSLARVALTISDLRNGEQVEERDVFEASHYFPEGGSDGAGTGGRRGRSASPPVVNSSAIP